MTQFFSYIFCRVLGISYSYYYYSARILRGMRNFQTYLGHRENYPQQNKQGVWSSGMILASGARGREEFDSRNTPRVYFLLVFFYKQDFFHVLTCFLLCCNRKKQ